MSVFGSVLAVGAVHVPVIVALAPVALLAAVMALWWDRPTVSAIPPPALVLVFLAAWSALQALPLPAHWVARISPGQAEVWAGALKPFGEVPPAWIPISIEPGASLVEALKWLSYAAVFIAAAYVGRVQGRRVGVTVVFAAAVTAAVVTLLHGLAGATKLFGLYEPMLKRHQWATSPIINPNPFSGYLNLGAFAGFGLLVARRSAVPRWLVGLGIATILGTSLASASRGGWASLLLGVPLLSVCLWRVLGRAPHRTVGRAVLSLQLGAVLLVGLILFVLGATTAIWRELLDDSLQKLELLDWTRPLIQEHFWVGVGRGGFQSAFPAFRGGGGHVVYQYAENVVVQWCAEWGVPVAALGLLSLLFFFRPSRLLADRDPVAACAWVGVIVLLLHNFMDLALELVSVAMALFVLLGSLWGAAVADSSPTGNERPEPGIPSSTTSRPVAALLVLTVLGLLFLLGAAGCGSNTVRKEREYLSGRLRELYPQAPTWYGGYRRELRAAVGRHPGDPLLQLFGAVAARRAGKDPLPWIGRSIERDPMAARPYLMLAAVLGQRGSVDQALRTLRSALEREPGLVASVASQAVKLASDDRIWRVVPAGVQGAGVLVELARHLGKPKQRALRERLFDEALQRDPTLIGPRLTRAHEWLDQVNKDPKGADSGPCSGAQREACLKRVEEQARRIAEVEPGSDAPLILQARVLMLRGQPAAAGNLLKERCGEAASVECSRWRVMAANESKDAEEFEKAVSAYLAASCSTSASCANAALWGAGLCAGRGDWLGAMKLYERSARESENPETWVKLADAASRAGQHTRAARALDRGRRGGARGGAELETRLARERRNRLLGTPP
ncbi:O-antigen ligase family protein [Myxococcota bacterium]